MALVEINEASIAQGSHQVVDRFSAKLRPGTITAVIGPNGCGKSSLLSAIAGDLKLSSGSITLDGIDLAQINLQTQAAKRSVVAQSRNYWLSYSVREVIAMGQGVAEISRIDSVMAALDMKEFARQSVTTLSGGQAQRVDIARALVRDSDIYLFDEPFSAQDSRSKDVLIDILKKLRMRGKTILLVTHSDKSELSWCDQIFDLGTQ
ncbi:MAG: ATP-binding cassette domain-containing protein [Candidatus Planktophila sp.]|jgi:ABC-type cobalamin/Fe3+-siderophores transport system ATPase subunit|tara:strand:+ start:2014 stop:2631 length:618 start_codon:yes stop_codon:yes gene_type:complete